MSAPLLKKVLPVFPSLVGGILLVLFGTWRTDLACERATGTCTWSDGIMGGTPVTFAMTDVREVRFVGDRGRHGDDGQVELFVGNRDAMVFGKGESEEVAQKMTDQVKRFLAGEGASLRYGIASRSFMFFLGGGLLCGAFAMLLSAFRKAGTGFLGVFAVLVALVACIGSIVTCVTRDDPGLTVK
jgi:hypothetical protein